MRGMLVVFGVGLLLSGIVGILFPRHIAEFVVRTFRRMGGQIPDPDPTHFFSVTYRILGVVQFGWGIAIFIYKFLRP
jgi:hypothetical protein